MEVTVFTPTYNRAYIIEKLYQSLKRQTFHDFEWIVLDDGSTDDTEKLFERILAEKSFFTIKYQRVKNGGKHRAINKGVKLASGRLFFIVDSDDYLPDDSLETIVKYESSISDESKLFFAGIAGLKGRDTTHLMGTTFEGDFRDLTYLETQDNNIFGDKSEVYYLEIMKQFPFPEFDNEKFIPESVVWNEIASNGYKLRYFNKLTYNCDYLEDGLTQQGEEKYKSIPKGYGLYLSQSIKFGKITKLNKWRKLFDYYRMYQSKISVREMANNLQMNPIYYYFRILGIRIFYKLYNR